MSINRSDYLPEYNESQEIDENTVGVLVEAYKGEED